MKRLAWTGLIAITVAACAAPAPTPPPMASGAAPAAPIRSTARGPVDGTYRGRSTATLNTRSCSTPGPVTIVIKDSKFFRRYNSTASVDATVAPDGTISGQAGKLLITGTVQNGHMEADFGNEFCGFHYTLDRA